MPTLISASIQNSSSLGAAILMIVDRVARFDALPLTPASPLEAKRNRQPFARTVARLAPTLGMSHPLRKRESWSEGDLGGGALRDLFSARMDQPLLSSRRNLFLRRPGDLIFVNRAILHHEGNIFQHRDVIKRI